VFTSPLGFPLRYSNLYRRVLVPAREAAGMEWITFHTFRHTCASLLFEAGRDVKQVASWLGHADPAFTLRTYVHLMDGGIGDADFLDTAVTTEPARVNPRSTRRMETAANLAAAESAETVD
jgi:integrase